MIKSYLDLLDHEGLRGWAVDSDDPYRAVPVKCVFNGRMSEIAQADQYRPDLVAAGVAKDAFHGFSARVPAFCWDTKSTVELIAVGKDGKDVSPPVTARSVPPYPGLITITNGLLTAKFSLTEGGTLVCLRSAEFPKIDNFSCNGRPYGRTISNIDLYEAGNNDPNQPIPTEGGWEGDGPYKGGSKVIGHAVEPMQFSCQTKMREWTTGKISEWTLMRTTWLDGRTVVSRFLLLNGYPDTKRMIVSSNWITDPNILNTPLYLAGDKNWIADAAFEESQSRVATLYDLWEGEAGVAMSFAAAPHTDKKFYVANTIATAWPRCCFAGWRLFDQEFKPQGSMTGWQFTTIAAGVDSSRQICEAAMKKVGV